MKLEIEKELEEVYKNYEELHDDLLDALNDKDEMRNHLETALMRNLGAYEQAYERSEEFLSAVRLLSGTNLTPQYISELKLQARQEGYNYVRKNN